MDYFNSYHLKAISSLLASIITFGAFIPYIISIINNKTKPHAFSWIIWGITTLIVFLAQLSENGGWGAYPIGISALITIGIAVLAFIKKADDSINQLDYLFLILSLSSLPIWYFTNNPLWAVIILTFADLMGFVPTFRKAYYYPYEESTMFFTLFIIRNALSIFALENVNLTTILFPFVISIGCLFLVIMILLRKKLLNQ